MTGESDQPVENAARVLCSIDLARPQIGTQELVTAKYVKRQEAVVIVEAMEEPTLLLTVDGVVGGIEVENDLLRRRRYEAMN